VTINGNEESCGPSFSAVASIVMASVDTCAGTPAPAARTMAVARAPPAPSPSPSLHRHGHGRGCHRRDAAEGHRDTATGDVEAWEKRRRRGTREAEQRCQGLRGKNSNPHLIYTTTSYIKTPFAQYCRRLIKNGGSIMLNLKWNAYAWKISSHMYHILYALYSLSWMLNRCIMSTMRQLKLEVDGWIGDFDMTWDSLWVFIMSLWWDLVYSEPMWALMPT
jgi:hypothetical protein